jgi:hypothetical protein
MATDKKPNKPESRLIPALREGICVVQMVLFKELRSLLSRKYPKRDQPAIAMLSGAITNELFGSLNMEAKFQEFRLQHRADIEQELLCLARELPSLTAPLTDALRMQALCDTAQNNNQEDKESERLLTQAAEIGLLLQDRELPLPAGFMAMARSLGDSHHLIKEITS